MNYFLVKTEPSEYSIDDLERDGQTVWDGVHNYEAINNIKRMRPDDVLFIYHSVKEKRIVGQARVVTEPFENKEDPRFSWAVRIEFVKKYQGPCLADFKGLKNTYGFKLVTHSRLSVVEMPQQLVDFASQS